MAAPTSAAVMQFPLSLSDEELADDTQSEPDQQLEEPDASNRAINASKARAIQSALLPNLLRLGFREKLARAALEAGVLEIDHYDADCELAYVDIFLSLVKMVCDAHVDALGEELEETETQLQTEPRSFLPFKWPVFDMAQFEFGNARAGTCFNSVCVLTNLPKVAMDRTEELMELLSCNLFCMIGDPIQVVIPSTSSTGRTKGHAFLEFDEPDMARRCANAVDGLTWGRGPFGRIRGNLFRQYQVKSPAEELSRVQDASNESFTESFAPVNEPFPPAYEASEPGREQLPPAAAQEDNQQDLFCDSDEESSDEGEWVVNRPLDYGQFHSPSLQDLSSDSIEAREQHVLGLDSQARLHLRLGWDDDTLDEDNSSRFSNEEDAESFDSSGVLEAQEPDDDSFLTPPFFGELLRGNGYDDALCRMEDQEHALQGAADAHAESLAMPSSAAPAAGIADVGCGLTELSWQQPNADEGVEKPWRRYCEDLILRNREMQEQVALARRRIVQLSHNNQKLHLLIDRVERDRDGLLFENDLLQTQLNGYEDNEEHHDSLMKELIVLRNRLKQTEQVFDRRLGDSHHAAHAATEHVTLAPPSGIESMLHRLSKKTLANYKMKELKEYEQLLENTLGRVRAAKEEKALEMQKKLDRQVEEQNELKLCVICLANEKTILCLPCRHLCLCKTCSRREEVDKCPICRLEIEEMLAVYS